MIPSPVKQRRRAMSVITSSSSTPTIIESDFEQLLHDQDVSDSLRARLRAVEAPIKESFLRANITKVASHRKRNSLSFLSPRKKTKQEYETPAEFVGYMEANAYGTIRIEVISKLKMLLRNERIEWFRQFIDSSGSRALQEVIKTILALPWRDDRDDQLFHETLQCLLALQTNEAGSKTIEPGVLGDLVSLLLSDKRPASFKTRTIVVRLVQGFISNSEIENVHLLVQSWFKRPNTPLTDISLDFIRQAHKPRPYRSWIQELEHVCQECFWIFLHDNTIPCLSIQETTEMGLRQPIVPSGYIGGVEWEAVEYLCAHLSLCNLWLRRLPNTERRQLRKDLKASHFEHVCGQYLRKASTEYFTYLHEELMIWVAYASADKWSIERVAVGLAHNASKRTDHRLQLPELKFD